MGSITDPLPTLHLGFQLPSERNLPINFEMFRTVAARSASFARSLVIPNQVKYTASVRFMSKQSTESDAEFDARYKSFFERKDIDGWECPQRYGFGPRSSNHYCCSSCLP